MSDPIEVMVIVKGTVKDAIVAANMHGIALRDVEAKDRIGTVYAVAKATISRLNGWFVEDARDEDAGPYRAGSLLWWGEKKVTGRNCVGKGGRG